MEHWSRMHCSYLKISRCQEANSRCLDRVIKERKEDMSFTDTCT